MMILLILLLLIFCACSNSVSEGVAVQNSASFAPMVTINAIGAETVLGTDDESAKKNERPHMKVKFTYNFLMAEHETTCGEFNSLLKLQVPCEDDSLPVTNITYNDAVLFANARSKWEKLDTVYTYTSASFDSDGHCVGLEGLVFHAGVESYRLPTEAEWVLVASRGWNLSNGWTADNSDYRLHNVCSISKGESPVCDMVGNAMEWVNDWLGYFSDTTMVNFAGAPDGGGIGERIVKGGSFRNEQSVIHSYSRGDVYLVTSSTKADYVGFRLAKGAIPNPSWMNRDGNVVESVFSPLVNSATVRSLLGTTNARLVFRNDVSHNLSYMDLSDGSLSVVELKDSLEVYHPEISPDGKWVAFCTGLEGVSGQSAVYVRSLENRESPAIKLDVQSAAIPRWRILDNGDTVVIFVDDAGDNRNDSDFLSRSTWQVSFASGKFGTPKKLFNGAYHGGLSSDRSLAVSGSRLLRAKMADSNQTVLGNAKDTIWYGGEQACNVSLAQDGSKRTAFLDFGGQTGEDFVGKSYGTHEQILIADSTGKLVQSIAAPSGYSFDHSEWAGNGIVATLANGNGAHTKVVYINDRTGNIQELVEGEELWHPCLWVDPNTVIINREELNPDSAGIYYDGNAKFCVYELREKMEDFWTQLDSFTVVSFGSSRALFGLDPREMQSEFLLNFAYSGGDMYGTEYLFENYILNHLNKVKYVVVEVTPNAFWRTREQDWGDIYDMNLGFHYDESHDFWKDGIPVGFVESVKNGPTFKNKETLQYRDEFTLPSNSWGTAVWVSDSTYTPYDAYMVEENFARFENVVAMAHAAGLKVIALNYPVHPGYGSMNTVGPYGPHNAVARLVLDRIASMDVIMMDENKWGNHDYTDEMAYDYDHLSYLGARQLTHRLDSLLQTLE